ncbi:sugar phosphate isomerase/epimerase [bacterium]|nr:sugar phosphate isomerase/epimerase [bacterium]RQV94419.1 MAG: hypothetical protein EH221_08200 [bacterium]
MVIGLTADSYRKIPVSTILSMIKWIGVQASEVTQHVFVHPERVLKNSRGMKLGLHLPNVGNDGYDLSSLMYKEEIEWSLGKVAQYGDRFQFQYAVFHPPERDTSQQSLDFYISNLHQIPIPLILENPRGWSRDRFSRFFRDIQDKLEDRLHGICLDIPHAHLAGEDWVAFYQIFREQIRVIHLSDCKEEEDLHLPFNCGGDLNLQDILTTLKKEGFDGILNLEIKPPSINHLDYFFETYMQTQEFCHPGNYKKMKRRMKIVNRLGRCLGRFFK